MGTLSIKLFGKIKTLKICWYIDKISTFNVHYSEEDVQMSKDNHWIAYFAAQYVQGLFKCKK